MQRVGLSEGAHIAGQCGGEGIKTVDIAEVIDGQKVSFYQCLIAFMGVGVGLS